MGFASGSNTEMLDFCAPHSDSSVGPTDVFSRRLLANQSVL
jgi:hypothetical protein